MTPEDRFWSKVEQTDGCWRWLGSKSRDGYGWFWTGKTMANAHRVAWSLLVGAIPDGKYVLHHCDNPECTNPEHLFIGTQLDNVNDMTGKGRRVDPVGTLKPIAKLTESIVRESRERHALGESYAKLAKEKGVTRKNMRFAILGLTWRHVSG